MKYLRSIILVSVFLFGGVAHAEPLSGSLQLTSGKLYVGTLYSHSAGSVVFKPVNSEQTLPIPDSEIILVKVFLNDKEEDRIKFLFDEGKYAEVVEPLASFLSPMLPYVSLPSNQTDLYQHWLAATYWSGDFEGASRLADMLEQAPVDELRKSVLFYRHLVLLEKGDFQALESFLKSPDVDGVFPVGSAARLYIEACVYQKNKDFRAAIKKAAGIVVFHPADTDWMPRAELLCARLYAQLEMPESAESVLTDIHAFYSDPAITDEAATIVPQQMNGE
jgi:tetratricopeptide (TPR) repeat protein